jgi:hypothetical protein
MFRNVKGLGRPCAVPKIVPSGRLDALICKLGSSAETRIFTSECQRIQMALKC